jgi:hypothetical protein
MDWSHIPYALERGVMISVNPDAHSIKEIDNIRWGIAAARKGGLTKDKTWNALPLKDIEKCWRKKRPPKVARHDYFEIARLNCNTLLRYAYKLVYSHGTHFDLL